jgi:hypothetical protein
VSASTTPLPHLGGTQFCFESQSLLLSIPQEVPGARGGLIAPHDPPGDDADSQTGSPLQRLPSGSKQLVWKTSLPTQNEHVA